MAGTFLQQFGHDIVLLHFIDKIIKKRRKELFYIVSPAMGPKIDIHFWNPEKNEYTSGYNISQHNFIPELSLRLKFSEDIIKRLNKESSYKTLEWYQKLSHKINKDLKKFVVDYCGLVEENTGDLPDVMGFDKDGKETIWAELKFEGFGKKARKSVLKQFSLAKKRNIPFYLIIPKKPVYGGELTNFWIRKNLPLEMIIFKFTSKTGLVTPKKSEINFIKVKKEPSNGKNYNTNK